MITLKLILRLRFTYLSIYGTLNGQNVNRGHSKVVK